MACLRMVLEVLQFLPGGWLNGMFPSYQMASSICSLLRDLEVKLGNVSLCLLGYTASLFFLFTFVSSLLFLISFWHLGA